MERRAAREEAFKLLFSVDLNEEGVTEEHIEREQANFRY